ncbi:MAG TPA: hypothetical protein VFP84_03455 [Kofleriaceae bacterium]|nr:hypothetical protein [Kofleriaceae bacterium]
MKRSLSKSSRRKLTLHSEAIRKLASTDLARAAGGGAIDNESQLGGNCTDTSTFAGANAVRQPEPPSILGGVCTQ